VPFLPKFTGVGFSHSEKTLFACLKWQFYSQL
jgi:hypothetical protein